MCGSNRRIRRRNLPVCGFHFRISKTKKLCLQKKVKQKRKLYLLCSSKVRHGSIPRELKRKRTFRLSPIFVPLHARPPPQRTRPWEPASPEALGPHGGAGAEAFHAVTLRRVSCRDHSRILVGDSRGRVFSWSVSDQPGRSAADHWVKDEGGDSCSGCSVRFSLTERRHHCRNCGQLFCQK